jgi:hypothetical protein
MRMFTYICIRVYINACLCLYTRTRAHDENMHKNKCLYVYEVAGGRGKHGNQHSQLNALARTMAFLVHLHTHACSFKRR